MDYRFAEIADIAALAEAYAQLEIDEGAPNPTAPAQIEKLFWGWLGDEHRVVLFEHEHRLAAYALYLPEGSSIRLLQLFVRRDLRGGDVERDAFQILRDEVWPASASIEVEPRWDDPVRLDLWRSLGFRETHVRLTLDDAANPS